MKGDNPRGISRGTRPLELDALREVATFRTTFVAPPEQWKWLEELRYRFHFAIEVLAPDFEYLLDVVPEIGRAPDLRAALRDRSTSLVQQNAGVALQTAKAQLFDAGMLRVCMFPLFAGSTSPRRAVGLLLLAGDQPPPGAGAVDDLDSRLDSAGQWLAAAIEATIDATAQQLERAHAAERMTGIIDVIEALTRTPDPHQILTLTMEALALWYDADVRVYRRDVADIYVLEHRLPGIDSREVVNRLHGTSVVAQGDVFRLSSISEMEEMGWDPHMADTLFMPIAIGDTTEWMFTVSGALDPALEPLLAFVSRTLGLLLTGIEREADERLQRRLRSALMFGSAPADAALLVALEALAEATGASSAHVAVHGAAARAPVHDLSWGSGEQAELFPVAPVEAGAFTATADTIRGAVAAGEELTVVVEMRSATASFSPRPARLVASGAATLANWIAGTYFKREELSRRQAAENSSELVGRVHGFLDELGRLNVGGAVAVVVSVDATTGPPLETVMRVIHEQVRSSDIVGVIGQQGAGVLLADATDDEASAVVERLERAAREQGLASARVGMATFSALSESPESLVARALNSANRGTPWT